MYTYIEDSLPYMSIKTDELRTSLIDHLATPAQLAQEIPLSEDTANFILESRKTIENIITGKDDRLLVVVGPCSIHDVDAAIDYAKRLKPLQEKYADKLFITMRVYFEKPRTTVGWKGLISDPDLDKSFNVAKGLVLARKLLLEINKLGLPAATDFSIWSPVNIFQILLVGELSVLVQQRARCTENLLRHCLVLWASKMVLMATSK